jgi:hypothetical protein
MNKTLLHLGVAVLVLGGVGVSAGTVLAYRGDPAVKGPNYSVERHEAMKKAFESNDYTAWRTLMQGRGRVTEVITKENFAQFAKAHKLAESGDLAGAKLIREELGLGVGGSRGTGMGGRGMVRGMHR